MQITNVNEVPLALAVWALMDDYDYIKEEKYISVTGLMKPLRQILLAGKVRPEDRVMDVTDFVASAMGHAFHDSIEKAWSNSKHRRPLKLLGYPDHVIDAVRINPEVVEPDTIPIYLEKRNVVNHRGYKIGGKFDMVMEGIVNDHKSTSAYTWLYGGKDADYCLQGSLYRWLHRDKITEDFIRINFIFTDWSRKSAMTNPAYPQQRIQHKDIPLMSLQETEAWIDRKLSLIERYQDAPQSEIPECSDEELWRSDPAFKYFSDPTKTSGRATRRFDTLVEANQFKAEKGKGVVITIAGEAKRCSYCNVFPVCTQGQRLLTND